MTRKAPPIPDDTAEHWPNLVGLAAYGLWKRMQAIMMDGYPYGHLTTPAGSPVAASDLARMVGDSAPSVRRLLDRLIDAKVITDDGTTFSSPAMIRLADISRKRSEAGGRGASRTNNRPQAELFAEGFAAANGSANGQVAAANGADAAASGAAHGEHLPGSHAGGKAVAVSAVTSVSSAPSTSSTRGAWEPDAKGTELLAALEDDESRTAVVYLLEHVAYTPGWVAELLMTLNPENMHGKMATPAQLGLAIRHFVGNGEVEDGKTPNLMYFGAYVRRAIQNRLSATTIPTKFGRAASPGRPTADYDASGNADAAAALENDLGGR